MTSHQQETGERIAEKARQMDEARRHKAESPLRGVAMFGMVGWAVALPVVAGTALGVWLDRRWPADHSWTLMMLLAGAALGAAMAWYWIRREMRGSDG